MLKGEFIGTISNIFVGVVGAAGPLEPIRSTRTEGLGCSEDMPRTFIPFLQSFVQSGLVTVTAQLAFYGIEDDVWNIARGKAPTDPINDGPENTRYSVFAVFPSYTQSKCFYFPDVSVANPMATGLYKNKPTDIKITFIGNTDNPDYELIYRGTISEMATIIGARFPNLMY